MTTFTLAQRQALILDRHIFVEAGAGSGKTTILVERYVSIFETFPDLDISQVVAFTFSNKAAAEMRHRVAQLSHRLPTGLSRCMISTIHAYAIDIVREFGYLIGIDPGVRIVDSIELRAIISQAIDTVLGEYLTQGDSDFLAALRVYLSESSVRTLRKELVDLIQTPQWRPLIRSDSPMMSKALSVIVDAVLAEFCRLKRQMGIMDFDDAIRFSVELLETRPQVLSELRSRIRFLMVDEFQDTDPTQWRLVDLLSGFNESTFEAPVNLFVVGDVKQSIYGFRGADATLFLQVQAQFQARLDSDVVILADNFRSTETVVDMVNAVFLPVFEQLGRDITPYHPLIAHRQDLSWPVHGFIVDDNQEVAVADYIATLLMTRPELAPHDIAILLRSYAKAPRLKSALQAVGVPATIHSMPQFYCQDEVVWILNWFKAVLDTSDYLSWYAVLSSPFVGIDHDVLLRAKRLRPKAFILDQLQALDLPELQGVITHCKALSDRASVEGVQGLLRAITHAFVADNACETHPVFAPLSRLFADYEARSTSLIKCIHLLEDGIRNKESLSLNASQLPKGHVQLMTIHASKGLEFPVVILPYCDKKFKIPHDRLLYSSETGISLSSPDWEPRSRHRDSCIDSIKAQTVEDEKKNFYVACTRAKGSLCFFTSQAPDITSPLYSYLALLAHSKAPIMWRQYEATGVQYQGASRETSQPTLYMAFPSESVSLAPPILSLTVSDIVFLLTEPSKYFMSRYTSARDRYLERTKGQIVSARGYGVLAHRVIFKAHMEGQLPSDEWMHDECQRLGVASQNTVSIFNRLKQSINRYWDSDLRRQLMTSDSLFEYPVSVKWPGSDTHILTVEGRFDAIQVTDTHVVIVDFKTDSDGTAASELSLEYQHQLRLYLALAKLIFPGRAYLAKVYFTESGDSVDFYETDELLESFYGMVVTIFLDKLS